MKEVISLRKLTSILRPLVMLIMVYGKVIVKKCLLGLISFLIITLFVQKVINGQNLNDAYLSDSNFKNQIMNQKILCFEIIEENWDTLGQFWGKERIGGVKHNKLERKSISFEDNPVYEFLGNKFETANEITDWFQDKISTSTICVVFHWIQYKGAGRLKSDWFFYTFNKMPKIINISKPNKKYWYDFTEIRFVEDIEVLNITDNGNVSIRYKNKSYECIAGKKLEFKVETKKIPASNFFWMDETGKGRGKNNIKDDPSHIKKTQIAYDYKGDELFEFKTKINFINFGYISFKKR